ncbi:MAG: nitric oxide reductase activation protein [Betaproteobacteria bacterium]|nr:nitric oxide reductase activation protein [Betaproteobacteria bacterium]
MSSPPRSSDPRLAVAASEPLTAAALEDRLDELLDPVLSSRRTATRLAQAIAPLPRAHQDFVLHWVAVIARTNPEMAYQFAAAAPQALATLDLSFAEAWIIEAMDTYDREGLYRGSQVFKGAAEFAGRARRGSSAVTFEEVAHVLELFVCALSGRHMRLDTAAQPYTDTETLHLPSRLGLAATKENNFLLYKAMTTLMWAQGRYGTFNADLLAVCGNYDDPQHALAILNFLETVRLEACVARVLPGLAREMTRMRGGVELDPRCTGLCQPWTTVDDSIKLLAALYGDFTPPRHAYMATLQPEQAAAVRNARLAREKAGLQSVLADMLEEKDGHTPDSAGLPSGRFSIEGRQERNADGTPQYVLKLDDAPVHPPENVTQLIDSILQDLGEIPDDYLVAAGDGAYRQAARAEPQPADVWKGIYHEEGAYFYHEWDHRRRHYRKNWCVLRELDVHPGDAGFIDQTLGRYRPQVSQLKRTFELLRGEDKLLKRQSDGNDIDLDAVIAAYADMRGGMELAERVLVKRHRSERNLAAMFMVDMSGSTKGWINDAEREALVMLCEALEVLGDRYAIYGFSGITRKRCEIFRVKRFDEPYDTLVKSRISGIAPQDYTRMGVAIRHLTTLLNRVEARTKLLVTLSDGKPDDYSDNYRGEYGIEDTRQALIEAHRSGIKPFCITIDREARDYLPHMYGPVNWTLVDNVAQLPLKVAEIYRRLTG